MKLLQLPSYPCYSWEISCYFSRMYWKFQMQNKTSVKRLGLYNDDIESIDLHLTRCLCVFSQNCLASRNKTINYRHDCEIVQTDEIITTSQSRARALWFNAKCDIATLYLDYWKRMIYKNDLQGWSTRMIYKDDLQGWSYNFKSNCLFFLLMTKPAIKMIIRHKHVITWSMSCFTKCKEQWCYCC